MASGPFMQNLSPIVFLCLATLFAGEVGAGISPENVIVVVNAQSRNSRTIANHYVSLRQIPENNVVLLKGVPTELRISFPDFKSKILQPLLDAVNKRGLAGQARVIAYSADFPTSVDIKEHVAKIKDANLKKIQKATASITGITYFYRFALANDHRYLALVSNLYARGKFERHFVNPFNGQSNEDFQSAMADLENERYEEAAAAFADLAKENETIAPLSIKAAEAHALAGNTKEAVTFLRSAIQAGWSSGTYLKESESLAPLLLDARLKDVVTYLPMSPTISQPPVGFAANRGWDIAGNMVPIEKGGVPYLLSCMLAVIHPEGSTVPQAVEVLRRSSKADRTFPDAEFHFSGHSDVRSTTRFPNVTPALVYLQTMGLKTDVFRGELPKKKVDLAGLMVGRAVVNLKQTPWTLVPGSIAENLTSYGGGYGIAQHTKITDFLHAGAAMSSGTVMEPYAIQHKFPLPMLYGFYADGATAIESFYLTVMSPYQLLIVGDPLTQAFAKPPNDWVDIATNDNGKIQVRRRSLGLKTPSTPLRQIEIYVGGRLARVTPPIANVDINVPNNASGYLDLNAVLVGFHPTEPRISYASSVKLKGSNPPPIATLTESDEGKADVKLECPGADSIDLIHFGENLGTIVGDQGSLKIDTRLLGDGPIRLRPLAIFKNNKVLGQPITLGGRRCLGHNPFRSKAWHQNGQRLTNRASAFVDLRMTVNVSLSLNA